MNPGTQTSLTLSAKAVKGSSSIAVNALTGTLNIGAIIVIAGNFYTLTAPAIVGATTLNIAPNILEDVYSGTVATVYSEYMPNVAFSSDYIYLATRVPAMPKRGDDAKDVITITDPVSGLSFLVALYGNFFQSVIIIGLAWGVAPVNSRHAVALIG